MAIKKAKGLLTYVSGYAQIEGNVVAENMPLILVIQVGKLNPRNNKRYFAEFKRITGKTSPHGKYDFNVDLPEGDYYMYVICKDDRIGKPDAYAYSGKTNRIDIFAGGRRGFDFLEIKKVAKPIEKIILTHVLLPDLDNDNNGCEWQVIEKIDGIIITKYDIENVMPYSLSNHNALLEKMAIAKTGNPKTPFEFFTGKHYQILFNEKNGNNPNPADDGDGIINIDFRNPNFISTYDNYIIKIIDVKDNHSYAINSYNDFLNRHSWTASLKFIYK